MKIPYKHLLRFLVSKPSIEELSDKLFQLGHEHEIEDSIFNMDFTPNRGDCLSLIGLARDLNVFYKTDLDVVTYNKNIPKLDIQFVDKSEGECSAISFLNIEIIGQISEYQDYLEEYFHDFGINKNNLFTDVSNYVAYEMGQPTHSYDFSLINGDITLKHSKDGIKFNTLLGSNITLDSSDLVFTQNEEVINLAGIIGGSSTACSTKTSNALIECAYFKPESVMGKAIKFDLHSDASHKFERGVDPLCQEKILRRIIQIISEHAEISKLEIFSSKFDFKEIQLDNSLSKINDILGIESTKDQYEICLGKLGFGVDKKITVPSHRSDIAHQNDLAEELARVIGYDNIPRKPIKIPHCKDNSSNNIDSKVKSFFIDNGFSEVINTTFCQLETKNSVKVDNPLDINRQYLRTDLIGSITDNLLYNEKRQKDSIKIFEISDVYSFNKNFIKEKKLALIVSGRQGYNYKDFTKALDKKYLISLFNKINFDIENHLIAIDRSVLDSKIKTPVFALEINISELYKHMEDYKPITTNLNHFIEYSPISDYPSSYRDISFSIKEPLKINEFIKAIESFRAINLKNIFLFDFYNNSKNNEIKLAYRFIFQSKEKTLMETEIEENMQKIFDIAYSIDSVSIPGLK